MRDGIGLINTFSELCQKWTNAQPVDLNDENGGFIVKEAMRLLWNRTLCSHLCKDEPGFEEEFSGITGIFYSGSSKLLKLTAVRPRISLRCAPVRQIRRRTTLSPDCEGKRRH